MTKRFEDIHIKRIQISKFRYFKNKQWGLKNHHHISIVIFELLVFKIPKFYCIDAALHSVQVLANSKYCLATSNAAERVPIESTKIKHPTHASFQILKLFSILLQVALFVNSINSDHAILCLLYRSDERQHSAQKFNFQLNKCKSTNINMFNTCTCTSTSWNDTFISYILLRYTFISYIKVKLQRGMFIS